MNGSGKTALITGATRGIGWEFAEILAARGFNLFLTGRDEGKLLQFRQKHDKSISITSVVADLSVPGGVARVLAAIKESGATIDVLVNNAGLGDRRAFAESSLEKQQAMIQVNIAALVSLTHGLLPGMVSRRSGRILNVASTAGFVPGPSMATYYATKAFVISFSYAIAFELHGSGVSVSVLCPGATQTDFDKTAGTSKSRLVRSGMMTPNLVAEAGVRGLLSGKRMIVPGFRNKLAASSSRIAPRGMAARLTSSLNSDV
jgi:short-subunit dehydrogenase